MKSRQALWKLTITTTLEAEDAIAEMLEKHFGQPASVYFDFEKKINRVTVFSTHRIPAESRKKVREGLNRIKSCGLNLAPGRISVTRVSSQDWSESWKRHFKPIEIRNRLLIKPDWSRKRPRRSQALVILNPGLSFGTGQHPTTEYCLEEIVRNFDCLTGTLGSKPSFLDLGTGSGILAIAAAKLGYEPVLAIDFDAKAVRIAQRNARENQVLEKMTILNGDVAELPPRPRKRFDLICANLISDLLIQQQERIIAQMAPHGVLVLAGILGSEAIQVRRKLEKRGLKIIASRRKKEWWSGSFRLA